ncbi:hypothetical protein EDD22DRAFT_852166 [Suillus occidentalis]|nr:hypothetical protein EDD22DRAFT_852166 [Suillus occidentalis]
MSSNWDTHGNDSHSSDFNDGGDILLANANFKFEDHHGTTSSCFRSWKLKMAIMTMSLVQSEKGLKRMFMKATTVPVVELPPKKRRKSGRKFEIFEGESLSMFMREVVELQGAISFATANLYSEPRRGSLQPIKAGSLTAYPNATSWDWANQLAESACGIALFCNQKHSPSLWNVLARQSVLGRLIKHSCKAAAAPQQSPHCWTSDSSSLELSMAAALTGEMEERASQMHIPEFVWSIVPSLVSAAAPAANTFQAEPIQRHHPPSVFPWVKISMAWVDIKDFTSKTFTGVANGDA